MEWIVVHVFLSVLHTVKGTDTDFGESWHELWMFEHKVDQTQIFSGWTWVETCCMSNLCFSSLNKIWVGTGGLWTWFHCDKVS